MYKENPELLKRWPPEYCLRHPSHDLGNPDWQARAGGFAINVVLRSIFVPRYLADRFVGGELIARAFCWCLSSMALVALRMDRQLARRCTSAGVRSCPT